MVVSRKRREARGHGGAPAASADAQPPARPLRARVRVQRREQRFDGGGREAVLGIYEAERRLGAELLRVRWLAVPRRCIDDETVNTERERRRGTLRLQEGTSGDGEADSCVRLEAALVEKLVVEMDLAVPVLLLMTVSAVAAGSMAMVAVVAVVAAVVTRTVIAMMEMTVAAAVLEGCVSQCGYREG
eukprot:6199814-Pleurochrysis_carterae.AAC.2